MSQEQPIYKGDEKAFEIQSDLAISDDVFEIRVNKIPNEAVPIYDEASKVIIGYRHESVAGVFRLYDIAGNVVRMEEKGLESSLIDPIDLIIVGAITRILTKGAIRTGTKFAAISGTRVSNRFIIGNVIAAMQATFRKLVTSNLKFTATTAAHMTTKGRHVPLHILRMAIIYGKKAADPQGIKNAFQYTIPMWKNSKKYILEVIVRESDSTILHFMYK